jgi:hypothetical protein
MGSARKDFGRISYVFKVGLTGGEEHRHELVGSFVAACP